MSENLRFAQTFSTLGEIPLLTSIFGCFPVEPFRLNDDHVLLSIMNNNDDDEKKAEEEEEKDEVGDVGDQSNNSIKEIIHKSTETQTDQSFSIPASFYLFVCLRGFMRGYF